jgi:hypothetical protein
MDTELETLREEARNLVEIATKEQLKAFLGKTRVKDIEDNDNNNTVFLKKVRDGDETAINRLTSLPAEVAAHLFRFISMEEAKAICMASKDTMTWCTDGGLIWEIKKLQKQRRRQRAIRLGTLFTRIQNILVVLNKYGTPMLLDDRNADMGFLIQGDTVLIDELRLMMPFDTEPYADTFGFDPPQPRRMHWIVDNDLNDEEIVETIGQDLVVTKKSRDAYIKFFYRILKNGWVVDRVLDYKAGWGEKPVIFDIKCRQCDTAIKGKAYTCSTCRTPIYCGRECQLADWDARHEKEYCAVRLRG